MNTRDWTCIRSDTVCIYPLGTCSKDRFETKTSKSIASAEFCQSKPESFGSSLFQQTQYTGDRFGTATNFRSGNRGSNGLPYGLFDPFDGKGGAKKQERGRYHLPEFSLRALQNRIRCGLLAKIQTTLVLPSPFFRGILLSRKPPETQGNGRFLKRTMVEKNGESTLRKALNSIPKANKGQLSLRWPAFRASSSQLRYLSCSAGETGHKGA